MHAFSLQPGEQIIDDASPMSAVNPAGFSCGYKGMFSSAASAAALAEAFPDELLIPENEWQARAEEMDQRKSKLSDIAIAGGVPVLNQLNTNYCWIFGPTGAYMLVRCIQGQPMVELSPASGGGPITNWKNVGGWGEQGLQWIVDNGLVPTSRWPATAIDRRYYTEENKAIAKEYRCTEWWRLEPRNIKQLVSCLLRRIPVTVGYSWWGHQVYACDVVYINGKLGIRIRNSWGDIPQYPNGFAILQGNKMYPDDAVAPRVAVAS